MADVAHASGAGIERSVAMIRHWTRLIWNRKRANFLIMVEIFISFLVLEGVMLIGAQYVYNYRHPLGFSIDNVWVINVDAKGRGNDDDTRRHDREMFRQVLLAARDMPEVESAAGGFTAPYGNSSWGSRITIKGRNIDYGVNEVTDAAREVFGIDLRRGRWFSAEDNGAAYKPVVLNERFAREVFGDEDPVGRIIPQDPEKPATDIGAPKDPPKPMRVIGVVSDFRQHGEFSTLQNYAFFRNNVDDLNAKNGMPNRLTIKVRPGTTMAFEEKLVRRLQDVARDWSFEVKLATDMREEKLKEFLIPAITFGVIACFLMLMVALGLTGVVWQNVTQRVREIGLRRAKGARIEDIHRQILGELAVMTSLALLLAIIPIVQLPLLPLPRALQVVSGVAFFGSIVISALTIYGLTIGCGWYPARLATRIQPAEALHYE
jgi:putative ABC transport system permease protein